jgi:spore germination protein YaaH
MKACIEDERAFMTKLDLVRTYGLRGYPVWLLGTEDVRVRDSLGRVPRRQGH